MRAPSRPSQYHSSPFDTILGTPATVRLLRELVLDGSAVTAPDLAFRVGLSRAGTLKALSRLVATGVVQAIGGGYATIYRINEVHTLADLIVEMFHREQAYSDRLILDARNFVTWRKENILSIWLIDSAEGLVTSPGEHLKPGREESRQVIDTGDEDGTGPNRGVLIVIEGEEPGKVERAFREMLSWFTDYRPYSRIQAISQKELGTLITGQKVRWREIRQRATCLYGLMPSEYED